MRILIFTLVLLLGWLQYRLWVGEGSLAEVHALKADIARQTRELAQLRARNQALAAEVAGLKSGNEALEERARMDLGMIKSGEVFLQVIEGQLATPNPEPKPEPKSGSKAEPKPESRPEAKLETKLGSKPGPKPGSEP
jgi:cell division protein FtsB